MADDASQKLSGVTSSRAACGFCDNPMWGGVSTESGCGAPYLGRPSDGRGRFGGHSRFSYSQGTGCHSARNTYYKLKRRVGNSRGRPAAMAHRAPPAGAAARWGGVATC